MQPKQISLIALLGLPEVVVGDDVGALILAALAENGVQLQPYDVVAIAQKIVSKAEGRFVNLETVIPTLEAQVVAAQTSKDVRLVTLILQESEEISRVKKGVLIVRHKLGFVSANAGIDRSNVPQVEGAEWVLLLPIAPDASAEKIHSTIQFKTNFPLGIIITDSHGRPHRVGTTGVAIGVAGMPAVLDKRGDPDRYGYQLKHTDVCIADELAAAASLLMGQGAESTPVVVIRGLQLPDGDGGAEGIYRPKSQDLYR